MKLKKKTTKSRIEATTSTIIAIIHAILEGIIEQSNTAK
jgi:uncharacterized membrane protein